MSEKLSSDEWQQIAMYYRNKVNELELQALSNEVINNRKPVGVTQEVELDQ